MEHPALSPPILPLRSHPASCRVDPPATSCLRGSPLAPALLALALAAAPVAAQAPGADGGAEGGTTLEGKVVVEATGEPVPAAYVELLSQGKGAFSNVEGRYALEGLHAGWDTLRVRYLSWSSERVPVKVPADGVVQLDLSVPPPGVRTVEGLMVEVKREAPKRVADFVRRMKAGGGVGFLTHKEIRESGSRHLSDALRRLPFVRTDAERGVQLFTRGVVSLSGMSDNFCRPAVLLNGDRWVGSVDDIPPEIVLGVEVYRASSGVPLRYRSYSNGCGLVMVWTGAG